MSSVERDMAVVASDVMAIVAKRVRSGKVEIPYNANKVGPEFVTVGDIVRAIQTLVASKT
jgi:hypothetical protein